MESSMIDKYIAPGDRIELQQIHGTQNEKEEKKVYFSRVNQVLDDEKVEILMPLEQSKMVLLPKNTAFNMVIYTSHGLFHCDVKITERYKNGNIFLQVVELLTAIKRYQRREFYRYSCSLPVWSRSLEEKELETLVLEDDNKGQEGTLLDIGGGGLRFLTEDTYEKDNLIACFIQIEVKGSIHEIQAVGKVLGIKTIDNNKSKKEVRLQFEKIANAAREKIIQYIFEDERRRRKSINGS